MSNFAISYDLLRNKDYKLIIDELTRLGAVKTLLSMWLVDLNNTAEEVKDHLATFMDDDDRLVVIPFTERPAYTRALTGTNDWVAAHA